MSKQKDNFLESVRKELLESGEGYANDLASYLNNLVKRPCDLEHGADHAADHQNSRYIEEIVDYGEEYSHPDLFRATFKGRVDQREEEDNAIPFRLRLELYWAPNIRERVSDLRELVLLYQNKLEKYKSDLPGESIDYMESILSWLLGGLRVLEETEEYDEFEALLNCLELSIKRVGNLLDL